MITLISKNKHQYHIIIIKEKEKEEYRILNLTKGIIYPCIFKSFEDAMDEMIQKHKLGEIKILSDLYTRYK